MRVLLLNQYYAPDEAATAQLLADVGEGFAAAGDAVTVVCGDRGYADPARRYPRRESIGGVDVRRVRGTGFGRGTTIGRLLDYATFTFAAARAAWRAPAPDRVLSLSTPPWIAWLGAWIARRRGAASVFWVMDVYPDVAVELGTLPGGSFRARLLGTFADRALAAADRVVTLDAAMADRLRARVDRPIEVVSNWADGDAIRPRPRDGHPLREAWDWTDRFVVMYSGNLGRAHDFETLLGAMDVLKDDRRILFAFVGDGPRRAELRAEIERRGLVAEFRPYQPRASLGDSLTAADVHLITLKDGLVGTVAPSKLYGVLAAGRPVLYVGPAAGETPRLVDEAEIGFSIRCGDAAGLAEAIRAAADGAFDVASAGARARAAFEEAFTKSRGLRRLRAIVEHADGPETGAPG